MERVLEPEKSRSGAGRTRRSMKAIEAQHRVGSDLKRPGGAPRWPGSRNLQRHPQPAVRRPVGAPPKWLRVLEISGNVPRGEAGCSRIWRPLPKWPRASRGAAGVTPVPMSPRIAGRLRGRPEVEAPRRPGQGPRGRAEVTYTAVLARPVHHRLIVRRVPLEHERCADERDLRPRSGSGHRRCPRPAPLARGGGAVLAGTRSLTGTRGTGLLVARLPILATAGQRALRRRVRRRPGQPGAGTQAPGLRRAPRRPAGGQQQQQQQERPRARRRRRRPWARGSGGGAGALRGARASPERHGRRGAAAGPAAGPAAGRRGRERPRPGERRAPGSASESAEKGAGEGRAPAGGGDSALRRRRRAAEGAPPPAGQPRARPGERQTLSNRGGGGPGARPHPPGPQATALCPQALLFSSSSQPPALRPSSGPFFLYLLSTYSGRAKCQALGITA